jgi:hypothetical protein
MSAKIMLFIPTEQTFRQIIFNVAAFPHPEGVSGYSLIIENSSSFKLKTESLTYPKKLLIKRTFNEQWI